MGPWIRRRCASADRAPMAEEPHMTKHRGRGDALAAIELQGIARFVIHPGRLEVVEVVEA